MVHAILGVRAPPAGGSDSEGLMDQPKSGADRNRVKLRLMSRRSGLSPDIAAGLARGRSMAKPNRTAVGSTGASRLDTRVEPGGDKEKRSLNRDL
jgi:hypothetical protein